MDANIETVTNGQAKPKINGHTNGNSPNQAPSKVAVVGAGIAGLSATIALRRAGWEVEVFERSQFRSEVGAAISVTPNATAILDKWGFDFEKSRPVPNMQIRQNFPHNLESMWAEQYPKLKEQFGHPALSFHRVDLHKALKELALDDEHSEGLVPTLRLGSEVKAVNFEEGVLEMNDGTKVQKDLIVIADGAHSHLIDQFTGVSGAVFATGRSAYRWLVPMEHVLADPDTNALFEGQLPGFLGIPNLQTGVYQINYTCRGDTLLNIVVVHNTQRDDSDFDLWNSPATKEQVHAQLTGFHPTIGKLVDLADDDGIKVYHLVKRPALSTFIKGRALVMGDAAHVMLPTHAAAGAVAIESAASLEVLFRDLSSRSSINENIISQRLKIFDQLRVPRCNMTMILSNAGPPGLSVPGVEDEIRKYYHGPLPPVGCRPWMEASREVFFRYDAYKEAEEALRKSIAKE